MDGHLPSRLADDERVGEICLGNDILGEGVDGVVGLGTGTGTGFTFKVVSMFCTRDFTTLQIE